MINMIKGKSVRFCLMCELEKLYQQCYKSSSSVSPNKLVANLKAISKHFRRGHQEDSHEFMRYVMDYLQNNVLGDLTKY